MNAKDAEWLSNRYNIISIIPGKMKVVYSDYTNKHILGTYPKLIGIELANHCDLEFIMCPQPDQTRNFGLIDMDLFK
jgi:hypothetical protein